MKIWKRKGYIVKEKEFDFDLHEFDVVKNDEVIATITPGGLEEMGEMIKDLDAGECVDGWEDGKGNAVHVRTELTERTLEIIEELGELPMQGISDLEGLMRDLGARGYACSISVDTNYLEVSKED